MHEMSYVVRFVNLAIQTAQKEKANAVEEIIVQVGQMTGVIPSYLHRYYPEAVKGTILEGSKLTTLDLPAKILCLDCGGQYHPGLENNYACPVCKSIQGKVLEGREVLLKEVRIR